MCVLIHIPMCRNVVCMICVCVCMCLCVVENLMVQKIKVDCLSDSELFSFTNCIHIVQKVFM